MKKIIIIGITILTIISISGYKYLVNKEEKINIIKPKDNLKNTNILTMMLENESGVYEETNASEWPTDGYVFNEVLSKCENGGILSWDNDTKKVVIQSNKSDKCYVYFDKVNIINFTIDAVQYSAEKDMTWKDWLSSKYNVDNYKQHCTTDYITGHGIVAYSGKNLVSVSEIILENNNYIHATGVFLEPCGLL